MTCKPPCVTIAGGGLAGSEAAWQLARRNFPVKLYEMRGLRSSPAHTTSHLAELVCSNSLGADQPTSPAGILKEELRRLDSLIIRCAERTRVPAGRALAVDRERFAQLVTSEISAHPNICLIREELREIPDGPCILAAGPLVSGALAGAIKELIGEEYLSFFDAAAPIVTLESVDEGASFRASRYGQGDDYINCPLDEAQYAALQRALVEAERVPFHKVDFRGSTQEGEETGERRKYFEGCLPVEVMAERGVDTLRFGPMRPVGLPDPRTGREPYALVQLRRDNAEGTLYNLVGFQTNLKWGEQERVFRMIPALAGAEFVRKGVMHRNTFVCAPRVLDALLRPKREGRTVRRDLFLAGQITGVEGYVESTAAGLVSAVHMAAVLMGREEGSMPAWPRETAIGSLLHYLLTADPASFQPMNVNLGIFPPLPPGPGKKKKIPKRERSLAFAERSREALESFLNGENDLFAGPDTRD